LKGHQVKRLKELETENKQSAALAPARNIHDALPCPLSVLSRFPHSFFVAHQRAALLRWGPMIMMWSERTGR
jgi:hypothetical protein